MAKVGGTRLNTAEVCGGQRGPAKVDLGRQGRPAEQRRPAQVGGGRRRPEEAGGGQTLTTFLHGAISKSSPIVEAFFPFPVVP